MTYPDTVMTTADRLRAHLDVVIGERHPVNSAAHHGAVARYIRDTFAVNKWAVSDQIFQEPHAVGTNVIGRRVGQERPERIWMVGAHYDTVIGTPGADDNGIAVAALLELATALADTDFRDTVQLVAWDMEERQGMGPLSSLRGSRHMAKQARAEGLDIAGVLDLEMIGLCNHAPGSQQFPLGFATLFPALARSMDERQHRGDFLAAIGRPNGAHLLAALERAAEAVGLPLMTLMVAGRARLIRHFYRSDHAPFWRAGYPALMLTDTADFRNGHYHRPGDTIETLDFDFAARVTRATLGALRDLAGAKDRA